MGVFHRHSGGVCVVPYDLGVLGVSKMRGGEVSVALIGAWR